MCVLCGHPAILLEIAFNVNQYSCNDQGPAKILRAKSGRVQKAPSQASAGGESGVEGPKPRLVEGPQICAAFDERVGAGESKLHSVQRCGHDVGRMVLRVVL